MKNVCHLSSLYLGRPHLNLIHILTTIVVFISLNAQAQFTKSIYLKPIEISPGPRYFYGGKPLKNGFAALEIPLNEMNDAEIRKHILSYRTTQTLGRIITTVPTIYFLTIGRQNYSNQTFTTYFLTSIGVSIGANVIANSFARKAVKRYNFLIANTQVGLNLKPLPHQQTQLYQFTLQKKF